MLVAYDSRDRRARGSRRCALLTPPGATAPLAVDELRVVARSEAGAALHQHEESLAREHPRRLLAARSRRHDRSASSAATRPKSSLMFAKLSPDGIARRLRARPQPVRRDARRRRDPPADQRRLADHRQRHVRLGQRGGARHPRRRSAGVPTAASIAFWQFDTSGVEPFTLDQRHRHASIRRSRGSRIRRPAPPIPRCASASSTPPAARSAG